MGIVGDVGETVALLRPKIAGGRDRSFLDKARAHYRKTRNGLDELATPREGDLPLHPQFVAKTLDRLAAEDTIFSFDVGTPAIWAARYLTMNGKRRLLGSFNHGSMTNALPHALGA